MNIKYLELPYINLKVLALSVSPIWMTNCCTLTNTSHSSPGRSLNLCCPACCSLSFPPVGLAQENFPRNQKVERHQRNLFAHYVLLERDDFLLKGSVILFFVFLMSGPVNSVGKFFPWWKTKTQQQMLIHFTPCLKRALYHLWVHLTVLTKLVKLNCYFGGHDYSSLQLINIQPLLFIRDSMNPSDAMNVNGLGICVSPLFAEGLFFALNTSPQSHSHDFYDLWQNCNDLKCCRERGPFWSCCRFWSDSSKIENRRILFSESNVVPHPSIDTPRIFSTCWRQRKKERQDVREVNTPHHVQSICCSRRKTTAVVEPLTGPSPNGHVDQVPVNEKETYAVVVSFIPTNCCIKMTWQHLE